MSILNSSLFAQLNQIQGLQTGGSLDTALGAVNLTPQAAESEPTNPKDIDALIKARTPEAKNVIRQSSSEASRLAGLAADAQRSPLEQFQDLTAFNEQNALLGLSGVEAQEAAIAGIPVSQFDQELNRRQRAQQQRQAFAGGDVSGASLLAQKTLGANQQADIIQGRIADLEPLVSTSRSIRSTLSGIDEAAAQRQAQLSLGRGVQLANVGIGATAPIIQSNQQRATLAGLQDISDANQKAQQANQLASLAGQFAPQIGSIFGSGNQPSVSAQVGAQPFIPEAGNIGFA